MAMAASSGPCFSSHVATWNVYGSGNSLFNSATTTGALA